MRFPWGNILLAWISAQSCLLAAESQPFQVKHSPEQPRSGEAVRITITAKSVAGLHSPVLQYQVVEPGRYIEAKDAAYKTNWMSAPMNNERRGNDAVSG